MARLSTQGYLLLAKSLGRAKNYIGSSNVGLTAFAITLDCIIIELATDNPLFDEVKFRATINAVATEED